MLFDILIDERKPHHLEFAAKIMLGLATYCKPAIIRSLDETLANHVVCWGWSPEAQSLVRAGKRVLIAEQGYIGNRAEWTSLGWGGLNGRAVFPWAQTSERWDLLFEPMMVKPSIWTGVAVIFGQLAGDRAVEGTDLGAWYARMRGELERCGYRVVFKPHPRAPKEFFGQDDILTNLSTDDLLSTARVAVAWSSNALVEAACRLVPTITGSEIGMTYPIRVELGQMPLANLERFKQITKMWQWQMAWTQWSDEEIRAGDFFFPLFKALTWKLRYPDKKRVYQFCELGPLLGFEAARVVNIAGQGPAETPEPADDGPAKNKVNKKDGETRSVATEGC